MCISAETGTPESFRSWEMVHRMDPPIVLSQTLKQVGPTKPGAEEGKT